MFPNLKFVCISLIINPIVLSIDVNYNLLANGTNYAGEKFPTKYLYPDYKGFAVYDIDFYLSGTRRTIEYFSKFPNDTNVNTAAGIYHTNVLFKVTLRDYIDVLNIFQINLLKYLIDLSSYILSHYWYMHKSFGWDDIEHRVARTFRQEEPFIASLEKFNRNRLKKWLLSNSSINNVLEQMDDASLPKEQYVYFVSHMNKYYPVEISDNCLSNMSFNDEPIYYQTLTKCKRDYKCEKQVETTPSIAYALSHRLLYLSLSKYVYRCYLFSEQKDTDLIDMMCAQMYRECVYIARRGYFARDMFLEHIALCGSMGYEEFFRRPWLLKMASWVDNYGCIREFHNFNMNRTNIMAAEANNPAKREVAYQQQRYYASKKCYEHAMSVGVAALAQAVRHSAHMMKNMFSP